jgi:hypothetical protein
MPFTLSHPAAAAPLRPITRRFRLPLAALAIGAMAPDFEYFLHLRPEARWSHSLVGVVTFCLPVGLAVFLAWEGYVRAPVRSLLALPASPPEPAVEWRAPSWWTRAIVALLLGAATHLLWDGFTHGGYWGSRRWPWLLTPALTFRGTTVPWFNLFQHVSTALGGAVVLVWLGGTLRRADTLGRLRRSRWRQGTLAGLALGALLGAWNGWRLERPSNFWTLQITIGRVAVGALLGLCLATLAFAVAFRSYRGRTLPPGNVG